MTQYLPMNEIKQRMQKHPLRKFLIPEEAELSMWVPLLHPYDSKLYLAAFYYYSPVLAGRPREIHRPYLHITLDPQNAEVVELTQCRYQDFAVQAPSGDLVGELRKEDLPAPTIAGLQQLQEQLSAAYDALLPLVFQPTAHLNAEERIAISAFKALFDGFIAPGLEPFYRALNPHFFVWLEIFTHSKR